MHGWEPLQPPDNSGSCHAERFAVDAGLAVVRSRYRPVRDLVEPSANPAGPRTLVLTFALEGESGYLGGDGASLQFRGGHTTVAAFHGSVGERRYRGGATVSQLRLLVDEPVLTRYLGAERTEALLPSRSVRSLDLRKTPAAARAHAAALGRHTGTQPMDALGIQIHALSLLAGHLQALQPATGTPSRLAPRDIEKLERVRDVMREQMDRPLTIAYLCAAAGLSEFKLKQGFRHRFNASPHRMLLEMRMHRAHALLEGGCQVAQAGWQVGYAHPGNFSAAFKTFFGQAPKSLRR